MPVQKNTKKASTGSKKRVVAKKDDKIVQLLEEILDISKQNLWFNQRVITWVFWQKVKALVYLVLIVAPLLFAIFYLPPILEGYFKNYRDVISNVNLSNKTITVEISSEHLNELMELEKAGVLIIDK